MAMILSFRASGQSSPSTPTNKNRRSSVSRQSAPRFAKSFDTFDLASFLDNLPPNTGPPGVTPVTGGTNTNTSTNTSKNLSHVPCKFFKQGICQAGKSCPFSHSLDGSLSADKLPCKYFQKGNCKFGLKCALAHILPDGTRVNPKNVLSNRRNNERHERSHSHGNGYLQNGSMHGFHSAGNDRNEMNRRGQVVEMNEQVFCSTEESGDSSSPSFISQRTTAFLRESSYFNGEKYVSAYPQEDSFGYGTSEWLVNYSSTFPVAGTNERGLLAGGGLFTPGSFGSSLAAVVPIQSPSMSEPTVRKLVFQLPMQNFGNRRPSSKAPVSSSSSSPLFNYNTVVQGDCAIVDDENELAEEDAYFEDYIPESLGDLILTPQEKKRRDSRSQSGTLLVRPDIYLDQAGEKRSMFPMFLDGPFKEQSEVFLMD